MSRAADLVKLTEARGALVRLENNEMQEERGGNEGFKRGYNAGYLAAAEKAVFDALNALGSNGDEVANAEVARFDYGEARRDG